MPTYDDGAYDDSRKRRVSDYAEHEADQVNKRQSYMLETNMKRTVAWHVTNCAPRGSCEGRELTLVRLLDQYLLSD